MCERDGKTQPVQVRARAVKRVELRTLGCVGLGLVLPELQNLMKDMSILLHPLLERAEEFTEVPAHARSCEERAVTVRGNGTLSDKEKRALYCGGRTRFCCEMRGTLAASRSV